MRFNPFDYTVPIVGEAFCGRPEQTAEIDYYLDEAKRSNSVNVVILGPQL